MGHRSYPNLPRAYLDLDGVLADFVGAAKTHGLEPLHFKAVDGAYEELPILTGSVEAVKDIEALGFHVFVLTKIPAGNPGAASSKLRWVKNHFPELADRVIITPDKGAVGREGHILIDDRPDWANCKDFEKYGGRIFHFHGDWKATVAEIRMFVQPAASAAQESLIRRPSAC